MDSQGNPLGFSNWGEKYQIQGILAPGEGILGATPSGGVSTNSGTSYATPVVSGIAALLLSLQLTNEQKPTPHFIRSAILNSAIGCEEQPAPNCRRLLAGRLNIKKAMSQIITGGSTMSDTNEMQENNHPEVIENAEAKASAAQVQEPDAGVMAADNNGFKESESPPQPSPANTTVLQDSEGSIKQSSVNPGSVTASECSCRSNGGGGAPGQLVFAIGQLGFDFGSEACRDSLMQNMNPPDPNHPEIPPNPNDPIQLLAYLQSNPWEAASIIWTLNFDATPIYAIQGQGAFASEIYKRFRGFLCEQIGGVPTETGGCEPPAGNQSGERVERISIGGYIASQVRLLTGQVVPVIWPELRCMYSWNTAALIDAVSGTPGKPEETKKRKAKNENSDSLNGFLQKVYNEFQNLGLKQCDRAINWAGTNAMNVANIFESALQENMQLDTIECEPSPICRPGSECKDVKLIFFDPENLLRARKVYRFTVDVSCVCPVMVGPVRSWSVR
jgi:cyanobactin maturation PatA/PatG family protease